MYLLYISPGISSSVRRNIHDFTHMATSPAPGEIPVGLFSAPRFDTWITSKYPLATYLAWVDFLKSGHLRAIRDSVLRANGIFCFWI